jgi:hypothetical protein
LKKFDVGIKNSNTPMIILATTCGIVFSNSKNRNIERIKPNEIVKGRILHLIFPSINISINPDDKNASPIKISEANFSPDDHFPDVCRFVDMPNFLLFQKAWIVNEYVKPILNRVIPIRTQILLKKG